MRAVFRVPAAFFLAAFFALPAGAVEILPAAADECAAPDCFARSYPALFTPMPAELFFAQTQYRQDIVRIMDRPGTSRPWYVFRRNNVSEKRIADGAVFLRDYRDSAREIARRYGVPPEIQAALIGIETHYGTHMGNIRVADALYTLGFFYPRRAAFFRAELAEFLQIVRDTGKDPFAFYGSFAGAMGMPQFMPSSYRRYAVDFDGDGFADIWRSTPDALASAANYLHAHGWLPNGRVRAPVEMTRMNVDIQAALEEKTALNHTVGDFRRMGVAVPASIADEEKALIYRLETSPQAFEYYLGFHNFYVLWQYNNSRMYVHAVADIAEGIRRR